jgi:cell division protein FtsB
MIPAFLKRLDWLVMACCLALLGYIAWHMQQGPRGNGYRDKLLQQQAALNVELQTLSGRNQAFESRVRLLRPESIDPDLVDELARRDLALALPDDRIVRFPQ